VVDNIELVRGRNVVAVIAFRETTIYPTDASPEERPEQILASDPHGRFHKVHHLAGTQTAPTKMTARSTGVRSPTPCRQPAQSCYWGMAKARQMPLTVGSPMSSSTAKKSPPRWWRMCASTSTTSTKRRCCDWPSTTSPSRPYETSLTVVGENLGQLDFEKAPDRAPLDLLTLVTGAPVPACGYCVALRNVSPEARWRER
jgi:hypothetical protein